ncbi:MAG: DoxX family protein [Pseudomonadota bacterium]
MNTTSKSGLARYLPIAARVVLGVIFLGSGIFGMLLALGVMPMPPQKEPMSEAAAAFMAGLFKSGYLFPLIKATEIVSGALLLANRFTPLALILLAPIVVNIFLVHTLLVPSGLPIGILVVVLEAYLGWAYRESYRALFVPRAQPS